MLGSAVLRYRGSVSVLIIQTMRCCHASCCCQACLLVGFKLPVCGKRRRLILEHSINSSYHQHLALRSLSPVTDRVTLALTSVVSVSRSTVHERGPLGMVVGLRVKGRH